MTDDLIARLRDAEYHGYVICKDAADALEAMEAHIQRNEIGRAHV